MGNITQGLKIDVVDLSTVKKRLSISVPKDSVDSEMKTALRDARSTAEISGFRKGAVPVNIIKARFGDTIKRDVAQRLIEVTYVTALKEKNLTPVEMPGIDVAGMAEEGKDFSYSLTVEVTPNVEIDGYIGMELKREKTAVTDEDVEKGLENVRLSRFQFKEVDRPCGDSDYVTVDFEASSLDGVPLKGYKAVDYPVVVGQSSPLPGFDAEVKGLSKGDKKDAKLKFPDNVSDTTIAGKEAVFHISVKSVKEKVYPNLDDELAKDLHLDNLEKLREKVREEVIAGREDAEKEGLKTEILDRLVEKHSFEVPPALVKRYHGVLMNSVIENMRKGMITQADQGLAPDALRDKYLKIAERRVREDIILDAISAKENIEVSEEEYETSVKDLAASRGVPYEQLIARIEREGSVAVIKDGLKHEKAFDIIIAKSKGAA